MTNTQHTEAPAPALAALVRLLQDVRAAQAHLDRAMHLADDEQHDELVAARALLAGVLA